MTSAQPTTSTRPPLPAWVAVIPVAILLIIGGFFAYGLTRDPKALPSTMIDRAMPEFTLTRLTPERDALVNEDLIGKVSLVNVFGSWCSSCVLEHPQLTAIAESDLVSLYGVDWRAGCTNRVCRVRSAYTCLPTGTFRSASCWGRWCGLAR